MKNKAFTLIELLIALILLFFITTIMINNFKIYMKDNTDTLKFKPVLASVSETIYRMINDTTMYPTKLGFADMTKGKYHEDDKVYEGNEKFRKLFKSKFNILENVEFGQNSIGLVPAYSKKVNKSDEFPTGKKIVPVDFNELKCFTENRGITYCLPVTCVPVKSIGFGRYECEDNLEDIYVRVYLSKVDVKKETTFDNEHAIYFMISRMGTVSLAPFAQINGNYMFDCRQTAFNGYLQCRIRNATTKINVYTNDPEKVQK